MTASRIGQRIIVIGRVLDSGGRPVPDTLRRDLADERGRPLPALPGAPPRAAGPELRRHRPRASPTAARPVPVRHHPAGGLPVGQPLQRLAARAHPLLAVRPGVHPADRHPDVLPGRPAAAAGPDLQLGARRDGAAADGRPVLASRTPSPSGRWPTGGTSCCAAASATVFEEPGTKGMTELVTPSQTVGPYFAMRLPWPRRALRGARRARRARSRSSAGCTTAPATPIPDGADGDLAGRPGRPVRAPR